MGVPTGSEATDNSLNQGTARYWVLSTPANSCWQDAGIPDFAQPTLLRPCIHTAYGVELDCESGDLWPPPALRPLLQGGDQVSRVIWR